MGESENPSSTQDLHASGEDSHESFSPLRPAKVGRYSLVDRLGKGGFGEVFLAFDEDLDRPVAIKIPRSDRVSRPEQIEAYLNEARILASLDHPHIVPVYDVGRTDAGRCFVVSKLIDGTDLATRIKQARCSFHESAELVATVSEALHYAHARGLVHRDIKPSNILIDAAGEPYVGDFGLALRDQEFGTGARFAGTPSYMSPEQAKGEGHRVDGRSDIFSLGVVFYELLTGRRPFIAGVQDQDGALNELLDLIATTEPRAPRQTDDTIPKELERICLKALSKRASDRFSTAKDLAQDLRLFLQAPGATDSPVAVPALPTSTQSDSDQRPIKVVPKGLRSFDEHDAGYFLELLPGPRDREGLPESVRFWKNLIESTDADKTFRVGLIYGPSGCGKSSLVKAGLLPLLDRHALPVYIEATPDETENSLLKGLRKVCPDLPTGIGLVESLTAVRKGRILRSGQKVLLVLDQLEQWLHAKRSEQNSELVAALRQCDGEHLQAVVMVRDDFWMAATRLMRELEIRLLEGENAAAVDLFDIRHARKVLTAFGTAYGILPERPGELSKDQRAFVDQATADLSQDGKVISVRLALFAEMVKGTPWTPGSLRAVGGAEGVGVTFLEETFSATSAPPEHRLHQKAARAVLKALLPESGTDIKGQMRSEREMQEAVGYVDRPRDFAQLIHILDNELRLITPTEPAGPGDEQPAASAGGRHYQLTHDYLVPSLRLWLTRKQRETRRGRAELRLADCSSLWNVKPETRLLPAPWEWAGIRVLTKENDWSEPQRKMMKRAGRVYGLRCILTLAFLTAGILAVIAIRRQFIERERAREAAGLVQRLLDADTPQVADIVGAMPPYRRWVDGRLRSELEKGSDDSRQKLHASLALLPIDATQVHFLLKRLLSAAPSELPVLRDALGSHRSTLTPTLWTALAASKPGDASLLPAASALATYDPDSARWGAEGGKIAEALVSVNSLLLRPWVEALRPVRGKLTVPIATIFQDKSRSETVHSLATDIITDYASDNPNLLAELLMVSDTKAYVRLFPDAAKNAELVLPIFRTELAKKATYSWNDQPLDRSWAKPDAGLASRIESAQGILDEQFAFCQTMPLDEFLTTASALRTSGYRPLRFRPYADEQAVRVAAVWARDGRNWRMSSGLTASEVRQHDERNRKDNFLPVDVAGFATTETGGKLIDRYAALWVEKSAGDDARLYVGMTAEEEIEFQDKLKDEKLIPRALHAMVGSDGRTKYCGVWGRPPRAAITGQGNRDQFEEKFEQNQADQSDQLLIDVAVSASGKEQSPRERAEVDLQSADKKLGTNSDDRDAKFFRAMAHFRLGENQKALDDLQVAIGKDPEAISAKQYKVIALARLGKKQDALTELARFQKEDAPEHSKLYLAAVAAVELGEGADKALGALEAAIKKQPEDADLRYDSACAFSLASRATSRSDKAKGRRLAERCLQLLKEAVKNDDADFGKMAEDADLDAIRGDPAFAEIMKVGHPDRRYAAVWNSDRRFEAKPIYALEPAAQAMKCQELIAQGYRPVSWSVARTALETPLVTASVWYRPVVQEDTKDRLAERQARSAVALVRMGKAEEVWSLLRHSADPRLRSFILNWLNPLGTDAGAVATELDRLESAERDAGARLSPRPAQRGEGDRGPVGGSSAHRPPLTTHHSPLTTHNMDGILFHPETSTRRALILALGTYGREGLSAGGREPLFAKLLDLYRNDPDAGIHGAAEWTLWKWGQRQKLMETDRELAKMGEWGDRRWFVNRQGQAFAVIQGPVEFRMGSPSTETERLAEAELPPRRMIIPRRFAIGAKEITVEQFQAFLELASISIDRYQLAPSYLSKYSPDPDGPWIGPDWYTAARYCNWLSEQEGLPRDQWCYQPNEAGAYAEGMSIPADALERKGYRLPTEAEWEYACRAGTVTSRYYGNSSELLGAYAGYHASINMRAPSMCGSLLPNDLGLFDTLGNVAEWCQENTSASRPSKKGSCTDITTVTEYIYAKNSRLVRGSNIGDGSRLVRAAFRNWDAPSYRNVVYGFRVAKTCP